MNISDKKREASRINGRKSRGPISLEGKRISSQNARKHAPFINSVLVDGEARKNLTALVNAFYTEFDPRTPTECLYVDKMAVAQWRTTRILALQTAQINHEIRRQAPVVDSQNPDPATRLMLAMTTLADRDRTQDLFSLQEQRFNRQEFLALTTLQRLQRKRSKKSANDPVQFDENKGSAL